MAYVVKKTIALVGMMGSGKTAVGTALARMLGVPFRDSDAEIVLAANMSIAEIFERDGEAFFREKEAQVLSRMLDEAPSVLSTGGGAYMREENRKAIHDRGVAVWLRADTALLWNRVKHKTTRPLLRTADPRGTLELLAEQRNPVYALAEIAVDADPKYTIDDMAQKVIDALCEHPEIVERQEDATSR